MTESERKRVLSDLYAVKVSTSLLYVTPEQAATDFFKVIDIIVTAEVDQLAQENLKTTLNIGNLLFFWLLLQNF